MLFVLNCLLNCLLCFASDKWQEPVISIELPIELPIVLPIELLLSSRLLGWAGLGGWLGLQCYLAWGGAAAVRTSALLARVAARGLESPR